MRSTPILSPILSFMAWLFWPGLGSFPGSAWAASATSDGSGLQISAAVDVTGKAGDAGTGTPNRIDIRSAEVLLFSPTDHLFDGLLNFAAHQESGEALFEIHEAYIGSSRLIPRSRFRLGQFFPAFGRLNQIHQHDWPFLSTPLVQRAFFGDEGVIDTGLELSTLLPLPFFLDITAGITNGWTFGHSHNQGVSPHFPTHYARAATYLDLPGSESLKGGMQIGFNYVGRKSADSVNTSHFGLDLTAKWRESRTLAWLFQSEIWLRSLATPGQVDSEKTLGAYFFPQYGLSESFFLGVRGDLLSILSLKDASGQSVSNGTYAIVPTLTYRPSEFSTLRASFNWEWAKSSAETTAANRALELQAVFVLGAHPAHDF